MPAVVFAPANAEEVSDDELSPNIQIDVSGVTLTKIAEHPSVVTPTGIDVDASGSVWAVCSHTHFRPDDYDGPEHDEVVSIAADGSRKIFYQATDATMDLELGSDGWVYLAERDRVLRVRDTTGDGVGDTEENIAVLDTEEDYPHNGLSGMAWHPSGDLVFCLGENYWTPWTLTGTDGAQLSGTGEGGVFRCRADGSELRRIARGFWNPFGICVRDDGTMFAAENDPGARPPCRLLHVVEGGDYGYQRRYGNAPFHPFVCWNGELRGTLPMMHSIGEAPCGIAPLAGGLIVPTWADHRVDFYPLSAKGASFETKRVTLVNGADSFRPVCISRVSDTQYYLTDWVGGSYELHGFGRIWRLDIDPNKADWIGEPGVPEPTKEAKLAETLRAGASDFSIDEIFANARSNDPFIALAAIDALSGRVDEITTDAASSLSVDDQLNLILAIRKSSPQDRRWLDFFWNRSGEDIRFETLRWTTESNIKSYRSQVESTLTDSSSSFRIFEASLATLNALSGNARAGVADSEMLLARIKDADASPITRAYALRLIQPTYGKLTRKLLADLLDLKHSAVTEELARTLAENGKSFSQPLLRRIANDKAISESVRADAIAGLSPSDTESFDLLIELAGSSVVAMREEALRSLRFASFSEEAKEKLQSFHSRYAKSSDLYAALFDPESLKRDRPPAADTAAWQDRLKAISSPVDKKAGQRIFHHQSIGTCGKCHRHSGRGNVVGPDLSAASNEGDPNRLLRSLLQPSRDVDPQFYPWSLITEDGVAFTGIMLRKGGRSGKEFYRDSAGKERAFFKDKIVQRKELSTSMMPEGLIDLLTDREIRDVLAFLDSAD